MSKPNTCLGPKALTQRAPTTLLSMPPDKATTIPFFRNRLSTCSLSTAPIFSHSLAKPSFRQSGLNVFELILLLFSGRTFAGKSISSLGSFPGNELCHAVDAVQIVRDHFLGLNFHVIGALQEHD